MEEEPKQPEKTGKSKSKTVLSILRISGFAVLLAILAGLLINSLLCVFVPHYYPTFGQYRLFAIVSDSMEPEIPTGNMIVGRVPKSQDEIAEGTVITYEMKSGNTTYLITHRVQSVRLDPETGEEIYTTKGDNADRADTYHPTFSEVVGIYTGNRCGFFGYLFGFLQSSQGAIALILIALIIALTVIIVHFVNLVTVWRKIALDALKKSGHILSETQIEQLGTIADVIGIVSKDPLDKRDVKRKDKKLNWFLKTGTLPGRPYNDDFDDSAAVEEPPAFPKLVVADGAVPNGTETAESATSGKIVRERFETMSYSFSYTARLVQLKPQSKEWYTALKNELLSYGKVRARTGTRCETFTCGRRTVARIAVRGKTLCLFLALDPARYAETKFSVEETRSNTPALYRIRSALRARYAAELIADAMREAGAEKLPDFTPQDYYPPYEGTLSLMKKGLVKRNIKTSEKIYRIEEISPQSAQTENAEEPEDESEEREEVAAEIAGTDSDDTKE